MDHLGKIYEGKYKYKYVPCGDGADAILKNATMKFTDPKDFNDPFDCAPSYVLEDFDELLKVNADAYTRAIKDLKLSPAKRIQKKKELKARVKRSLEDGTWQEGVRSRIGICSMTTKASNLLMWAHYAKEHTGVVFEFHNVIPTRSVLNSHYLCAFHVEYKDVRPVLELSDANYVHDLLTKGVDWKYEDEIRCLNVERKSGIYKYKRELLASVILGARINADDEANIRKLVKEVNQEHGLSIEVYQAEVSKDKFKLVIPDHPVYADLS